MTQALSKAEAWNDFWRGQQGGCLPEASSSVDAALRAQWHNFAATLPRGAKTLDLATGNAVVLRWLREARDDLELIGVDLADALPEPPPGIVTRAGVALEALPFPDGSFDAAVSQFGFEYADVEQGASEAARVLRGGGMLSLVTHHAAGPIVAQNRRRATGLRWVLEEARLVDLARSQGATAPRELESYARAAIERFGAGSAGWQLAEAIAQVSRNSRGVSDRQAAAMLDRLERMARGELQRIGALEQASEAVAVEGWLETILARHGFRLIEHARVTHAPDGLILADFRSFRRA